MDLKDIDLTESAKQATMSSSLGKRGYQGKTEHGWNEDLLKAAHNNLEHRKIEPINITLNRTLTREGQRIMMVDIDGNPLTPDKIAHALVAQG